MLLRPRLYDFVYPPCVFCFSYFPLVSCVVRDGVNVLVGTHFGPLYLGLCRFTVVASSSSIATSLVHVVELL